MLPHSLFRLLQDGYLLYDPFSISSEVGCPLGLRQVFQCRFESVASSVYFYLEASTNIHVSIFSRNLGGFFELTGSDLNDSLENCPNLDLEVPVNSTQSKNVTELTDPGHWDHRTWVSVVGN